MKEKRKRAEAEKDVDAASCIFTVKYIELYYNTLNL